MTRRTSTSPPDVVRAQVFEVVLDHLPLAVGVWSLPEGEFDPRALTLVALNEQARRSGGSTYKPGRTMEEMMPDGVRSRTGQALVRAIRFGESVDLGETAWVGEDGIARWYQSKVVPVGGAAACVLAEDVTERRKTEYEATLFKAVAQDAPIALSVWHLSDPLDPGSFILEVANVEAARLSGTDLRPMYGRRMDELVPETVRSGRAAIYADVALGRVPVHEGRIWVKNPVGVEMEIITKVYRLPGSRIGLSTISIPSRGEPRVWRRARRARILR